MSWNLATALNNRPEPERTSEGGAGWRERESKRPQTRVDFIIITITTGGEGGAAVLLLISSFCAPPPLPFSSSALSSQRGRSHTTNFFGPPPPCHCPTHATYWYYRLLFSPFRADVICGCPLPKASSLAPSFNGSPFLAPPPSFLARFDIKGRILI